VVQVDSMGSRLAVEEVDSMDCHFAVEEVDSMDCHFADSGVLVAAMGQDPS
jgi:hypothetical protein